jgi:flagellar assembly protein FliH
MESTMQLSGYCFPEIATNTHGLDGEREPSPSDFKRLAPGARAAACRLDYANSEASSTSVVEDRDQEAYCRGFSDGEKSGFVQGERAGREAGRRRVETALKDLETVISELRRLQGQVGRELEWQTVQLALEVARTIIGRDVQTDPQALVDLLRTAVSRLEHAGHLAVRMNPEDMQRIAEVAPGRLQEIASAQGVSFEGDAAISSGGFRIESDAGEIDARQEQRFKAVQEAFRSEWHLHALNPG